MDKKEFQDWFDNFNSKYNGICPPDGWFDEVVKTHEKLQEKIGGHTLTIEIKLDNYQNPARYPDIEPEVNELCCKIPTWFWDNGIKPGDLCFPIIRSGPQEGMKWGRHIEFWRKKRAPNIDKDDISKILGRLGEKWAKCKTEKQKLYTTMTVHPASFVALGHYAPDISLITGKPSCWQQGMCNQTDKYKLSVCPNSFVMLVGVSPFDETWNNLDVESRVWGVPNKELDVFHLSNFYFKANLSKYGLKSIPIGNIHNAWKSFFQNLLDSPVDSSERLFTCTGVFQNKQGSISYYRKGQLCNAIKVPMVYRDLDKLKPCRYCNSLNRVELIDEQYPVCENCIHRVPVCEVTNERTFAVVNAYDPYNNKAIRIKTSLTQGENPEWVICDLTGYYARKDTIVRMTAYAGGYKAALAALKARKYSKCLKCELYEVLEDAYGIRCDMCYQCRTEEAKKKAKTTYVKLKGLARTASESIGENNDYIDDL